MWVGVVSLIKYILRRITLLTVFFPFQLFQTFSTIKDTSGYIRVCVCMMMIIKYKGVLFPSSLRTLFFRNIYTLFCCKVIYIIAQLKAAFLDARFLFLIMTKYQFKYLSLPLPRTEKKLSMTLCSKQYCVSLAIVFPYYLFLKNNLYFLSKKKNDPLSVLLLFPNSAKREHHHNKNNNNNNNKKRFIN